MVPPGVTPPKWFLRWTNVQEPVGDEGRPWGDGSEIARRKGLGQDPWDTGCRVTPLIGGQDAMTRMADELQAVIDQANALTTPKFDAATRTWPNGHVYIADWRFNCLRDLSTLNPWGTNAWGVGNTAVRDKTAIGLVRKLMQAGIQVRLLLWMPYWLGTQAAKLHAHVEDHCWAARLVEAENARLMTKFGATAPAPQLGVVALDMRTADVLAASHHQKLLVIRSPWANIAFAGGVDLAFTRRDILDPLAPGGPALIGDWQSGEKMPQPSAWPRESDVDYYTVDSTSYPSETQGPDLPVKVYGDRQSWHDQHLVLEGEVVATLEEHFRERWHLAGDCCLWSERRKLGRSGQVILSTDAAFDRGVIEQLPPANRPVPVAGPAPHPVQMWRTIPLSKKRTTGMFQRGEFTVMAGLANACLKATEFIWIFDQFFWSVPLARLLREQVNANASLHVAIVLPPHADTQPEDAHQARHDALAKLTADDSKRIAIYAMWNPTSNNGIYVHAKVQMFDDDLLVCGSANLNRRSFLCDTELAFAVADATVLDRHQQALWSLLFPGTGFPGIAGRSPGWGAKMFDAIKKATRAGPPSKLIYDPWEQELVSLDNGAHRRRSVLQTGWMYDHILDATSVDPAVERGTPTLAKIVDRLEERYKPGSDGKLKSAWRKPS